ncbi:MAG: nucleotidyltransferase domain-containing protein [bacterium]
MNLEFYSEKRLKGEILEIIGKYLNLDDYKIFFFGSRVSGDNFLRSDIDIGIEGAKELPIEVKFKIEEDIERLPTLYRFEFVDFKRVSNDFKKEALKFVEYIR